MSERVTWETCPNCDRPAAVGWEPCVSSDSGRLSEEPVEFDCPAGCRISAAQIRDFAARRS